MLHLLQHRVRLSGSKGIAGQQQYRNLIRRRCRGSCQHIGRARADGGRTGHNPPPPALFGKSSRRMHHPLLIAALIHLQSTRVLLKRLPKAKHVAVAENSKHTLNEALRPIAEIDILLIQKLHQRLRRC